MGDGCKLTIDGDLPIETKRQIFGGFLRAAREGREKSLTELVHATRISPNFVMALESGDFESLPGKVFGRGFIKNLCVALDVPPKDLIDVYEMCWDDEPARYEVPHHSKMSRSRRSLSRLWGRPVFFAGLAAAGLVTLGGWYFLLGENREVELTVEQATEPAEVVASSPLTEPAAPPIVAAASDSAMNTDESVKGSDPKLLVEQAIEPQEGGLLKLTVLEEVGIRWTSDDHAQAEKLWKAGVETLSFQETLSITIKDAAKVNIFFQGRDLGPLGSGERKLTFSAASKPIYAAKKI
ncbi:MAG: helix-turn-helix domain-containing protein [Oligoflexales bacterium]